MVALALFVGGEVETGSSGVNSEKSSPIPSSNCKARSSSFNASGVSPGRVGDVETEEAVGAALEFEEPSEARVAESEENEGRLTRGAR